MKMKMTFLNANILRSREKYSRRLAILIRGPNCQLEALLIASAMKSLRASLSPDKFIADASKPVSEVSELSTGSSTSTLSSASISATFASGGAVVSLPPS